MFISEHFVMINFPKTGTSFVRSCLNNIYADQINQANPFKKLAYKFHILAKPTCLDLMLPNIEYAQTSYHVPDQHGKVSQIPRIHRSKPVASICRNPFDRAVSGYEFGWWKDHLYDSIENIKFTFPNFPNLSFPEYLMLMDRQIYQRIPHSIQLDEIGIQTVEFMQYYFFDPISALTKIDDEYIYSGAYKQDMPKIKFLRTEYLNDDLFLYLSSLGFDNEDLLFIKKESQLRPGNTERSSDIDRAAYWTSELIETRLHKERYLFRMLEDHGIVYSPPESAYFS